MPRPHLQVLVAKERKKCLSEKIMAFAFADELFFQVQSLLASVLVQQFCEVLSLRDLNLEFGLTVDERPFQL